MKKALLDSSFLVAIINPRDAYHAACVEVALDEQLDKRIVVTAVPETCYLLHKWLGHHVMRNFIANLQDPRWKIEQVQPEDFSRVNELLNQYADSQLDLVDATIIAAAERLNIDTVLTLDQRDFRMVRPLHVDNFEVRP
jgi:predicted nucleic acid-binding protein